VREERDFVRGFDFFRGGGESGIGVAVFAAGAGLLAYRYYTRPVTLTVAVGSIDGEAAKAMSALASELVSTNAPVRLKVIDSGTSLEAAKVFRTTRC